MRRVVTALGLAIVLLSCKRPSMCARAGGNIVDGKCVFYTAPCPR